MANKRKIKKFELRLKFDPRKILIWVLVVFSGIWFLGSLLPASSINEEIPLSQALKDIKDGQVEEIMVEEEKIVLKYSDKTLFSIKESSESMTDLLEKAGIDPSSVNLQVKNLNPGRIFSTILEIVVPILAMLAIFYFLSRQAGKAQDSLFSFGKSRARRFAKGKQKTTFTDVGGVGEAKKELEEIVDFLKNPKKYRKLGARTPKGALLIGPSGTGKTLLAKAVAGEANVPFFSMAGSEFMEMLVGVGASRCRDLFSTAKRSAPSIIFIDELDAIGGMRGMGIVGGHREQEQTLNQILVEMDGFTPNDHCIVLAASVTGETPILIKEKGQVKLLPIGDFIDKFYQEGGEGEKEVEEVETLGFDKKIGSANCNKGNVYFGNSAFKKVRSIFRHKMREIYEIEYLGGKLRATGNHSVFVRTQKGVETKAVSELTEGDVLVALPMKVNRTTQDRRRICTHNFSTRWKLTLPVYYREENEAWEEKYLYALENAGYLSQEEIAVNIGVAQTTVSFWQRGINGPRALSKGYFKHELPEKVEATPELMRVFGYYTAEGYARKEVDFCFSIEESEIIQDLIKLMEKIFGLKPDAIRHITPGAVNIVYYSRPLAAFFERYCGKGAKNKHIPPFLFEAPFKHFREFLRGVFKGDGYQDKRGRGEITSVSRQLILELNWLAAMHGIRTYISSFTAKEGRRIKEGKPLKPTVAYRLGWGKSVDPFRDVDLKKAPWRRAIVKSVRKLPFNGFVYDLCGCENEAFFGGERPVLLHNTNRPDLLDSALTRPGRFDRRIVLDMPDLSERLSILKIHSRGKPFAKTVNWKKAAKRTVGFSGADLENMLNEAAILAARNNKKTIDMEDIEEAATKVKLGPEKKRLQSEEERKMTAYHEAGHAVTAYFLPTMDPVHRVSIVSRGMALGFTLIPPEKDKYTETKTELLEKIIALLGGRAAEELIFKEFTGGAASDIGQATKVVRKMVIEYGMSDLGPIYLGPQFETMEWGRTMIQPSDLSEEMQAKVDVEIKKVIDSCYERVKEILKKRKKKLDLIAKRLIEQETIEGDEFAKLMGQRE